MKLVRTLCAAALSVAACALSATSAQAQATRTWVSGVGDDVNPCSRTAPCKTFAGAISKTAAGGEINCLDPGGFGAVTIVKSITISCPYTEGGALAGGNGITVNLPAATDVVFIRGLDIFGVSPPSNGIRFVGQGSLHVEDTTIRRFNAANSAGISFAPSGFGKLYLSNVTVADNGSGASGGGILIQPSGGTGSADIFMTNVRVHNNANNGIRIDSTTSAAGGVAVSIEQTDIAGNGNGISTTSGVVMSVLVNDSNIVHNSGTGIAASGISTSIIVGNTTIMGNMIGVSSASGAALHSYGDNRLDANPSLAAPNNGAFLQPPLPKK
jgi:hypothetical protein